LLVSNPRLTTLRAKGGTNDDAPTTTQTSRVANPDHQLAVRTGFEPVKSPVTGECDRPLREHTVESAGGIEPPY
jgi:hypothetical protein